MAETPTANEALLREVDEAVRQDQLKNFWHRFGRWIVVAVFLGLALLGGWLYWNHNSREASGALAEKAQEALRAVSEGKEPIAKTLEDLKSADQPGYRAMAMLTQAGIAAQKDDFKHAAQVYESIAMDEELARPYRDLATVRAVALTYEELKPQQVIDRLRPLAVKGNPWYGSAGEMTAIAYMKMGNKDAAGPIFAAIANDASVPTSLRSRARQMAGLLGVDAVDTEEDRNGQDEAGDAAAGE